MAAIVFMKLDRCFYEIDAYCNGDKTGHVLLVNTQDYDIFHRVLGRLQADKTKKCVFVSDHCETDGLPNLDDICSCVTGDGNYVLIGISQAAMLRSHETLRDTIGKLLELPIRGHAVILLDHAASYIQDYMAKNKKVAPKVVLVEGSDSPLPRIRLARTQADCIGKEPLQGMKQLFAHMEKDIRILKNSEITVVSSFKPTLFSNSAYSVTSCDKIYIFISRKYPDIAYGTEEKNGTEEQWRELATLLEKFGSLSSVLNQELGPVPGYAHIIGKVWQTNDLFKKWLLWLGLKVFGAGENIYLSHVLKNSNSVSGFEEHIYNDLLEINVDDPKFDRYYTERKNLIMEMPKSIRLIASYCNKVGRKEKYAVHYLTDLSDREKLELMNCLSMYDYSEDELMGITKDNFRSLYLYLQPFKFTSANTKLAEKDEALRDEFTDYFRTYKLQKVTNRIQSDFISQVERYAETRPYNKLQLRSAIVRNLPQKIKDGAQLFFFDALGVEYLAYIMSKCREYDLMAELSIGHSLLPSITSKNKEFIQSFKSEVKKIDDLDELKHHSQVIDYTKCKVPVHLFSELTIIDNELKKIHSHIENGDYECAVVIADHGASRLAVIHGEENKSSIALDERAEHSGRCCQVEDDPKIPCAAFEDGFVILANYSRFKGGRKANVEVHGGATLEEVLVPVITITRKPENIEIYFVNPLVELRGKNVAVIKLFSNVPLEQPRLFVNEIFYDGDFEVDRKYIKFQMPELKRSRDCVADVYDGDILLKSGLKFRVQKNVAKDVLSL